MLARGATSARMCELVLMTSKKIFCDSLHLVPPNPDHGYVNWYDPCKQSNLFS